MSKQHFLSNFKQNDDAVSGIIVAVMIIGLAISVFSIIQTVYVPQWMTEREATHMMEVADQISELKHSIDNLIITEKTTPVSAFITLGSKELGFFSSARAFGRLQVVSEGLEIKTTTQGTGAENTYSFYTLRYTSENAYYIDQTYSYESGAVILSQSDGAVITHVPSLTVIYVPSGEFTISLSAVDIEATGGVSSLGGYGTYPLQISYKEFQDGTPVDSVESLIITSPTPRAWGIYFNRILQEAGLDDVTDYDISYPESNQAKIIFYNQYPSVDIDTTVLIMQLSPGWM